MKVALIGVLVFVAFAAGWWVRGVQDARTVSSVTAPVLSPAERAAAQAQAEKCRDDCEQRNIVGRLGDEWLRNCRFGCNGPPRPYEPVRSISVAPADHAKK